ncbi:MAG: hypothetical protein ACLQVY_11915 [Limisphaerales bacterium]
MRLPRSRGRLRYELIALPVVFILGILLWRSPRHAAEYGFSQTSIQPAAVLEGARDTNQLKRALPIESGPEGYVGSAKCKDCHPKQFDSWCSIRIHE